MLLEDPCHGLGALSDVVEPEVARIGRDADRQHVEAGQQRHLAVDDNLDRLRNGLADVALRLDRDGVLAPTPGAGTIQAPGGARRPAAGMRASPPPHGPGSGTPSSNSQSTVTSRSTAPQSP